jgi:putative alpha-1,2-mannosidase
LWTDVGLVCFFGIRFLSGLPGSDQYVLGAPFVKEATIKLENGKTFTVKSLELSDKNVYVKSIKLNGKPYKKSFLTHSDIVNGGELIFEMGARPVKQSAEYEKPYSFTK